MTISREGEKGPNRGRIRGHDGRTIRVTRLVRRGAVVSPKCPRNGHLSRAARGSLPVRSIEFVRRERDRGRIRFYRIVPDGVRVDGRWVGQGGRDRFRSFGGRTPSVSGGIYCAAAREGK